MANKSQTSIRFQEKEKKMFCPSLVSFRRIFVLFLLGLLLVLVANLNLLATLALVAILNLVASLVFSS